MKKQNETEKLGEKAADMPVAKSEKSPPGPEAEKEASEEKPEPATETPDGKEPGKAPGDGQGAENGEGAAPDKITDKEPPEEKPEKDPAPEPDKVEKPADQEPAASPLPAAEGEGDAEKAQLQNELLTARSQLAAYAAGIAPEVIADAVTLAAAEAGADADEAAVTKAMQAVLKRHPEWKADGEKKKTGGFKLGADPDKGGGRKQGGDAPKNAKRWNRFK